jgi:organic hydroperoxide reductase OsmC/OhrA
MKGVSEFKRAKNSAQLLFQSCLSCYDGALLLVKDRAGLEIGGTIRVVRDWYALVPIDKAVGSLNNCVVSDKAARATLSHC